ncbi:MAG: prolipoprotein diacylglyceryl transferase [Clostridia bacterium]|nr:prolipoprotein diacylglyceryl transferase [Clostridia bacterium]
MLAMPSSRMLFGIIPWYSALIVTGICLALFIASREEKRLQLPQDTVVDLALWVIPFGVIGARLYYVVFAWDTFAPNPVSILYIWQGGLAIYGGIIGGLLAVLLFSRKRGIPVGQLTDIIAPGLALAQAIGRWGNYFNMEAYGITVTAPAWQFFPAAVLIPGPAGNTWHLATFFYESMWNLIVFTALMLTRKRMRRTGDATLWYFLLYGAGRLIIEGLRTDSLYAGSTLRISQVLAICICICVLVVFLLRCVRQHGLSKLFRLRSVPMLVCIAGCIGLSLYLAQAGFVGIEAATLQCAAFSLTTIISSITIYTA